MKLVYPKEEVCITCRLCEVACIVEHSKTKDLLMTLFGIGDITSSTFIAVIGTPDRFEDSSKVVSYIGLGVSTYNTGESIKHGRHTQTACRSFYYGPEADRKSSSRGQQVESKAYTAQKQRHGEIEPAHQPFSDKYFPDLYWFGPQKSNGLIGLFRRKYTHRTVKRH